LLRPFTLSLQGRYLEIKSFITDPVTPLESNLRKKGSDGRHGTPAVNPWQKFRTEVQGTQVKGNEGLDRSTLHDPFGQISARQAVCPLSYHSGPSNMSDVHPQETPHIKAM
jgi:hypothetical protein